MKNSESGSLSTWSMVSPSYWENTMGRSNTAISGTKEATGAVWHTTMSMPPHWTCRSRSASPPRSPLGW